MEEGERMVSISSFMGNTRRSGSSPCKSLCSLSHSSEMIGTLYLIPVYPELVGVLGRLRWIWIARYIPASYLYQKAMSWKAK